MERAGETFGAYLPRIVGALAILIVGLLVVRLLARLLVRVFVRAGVDRIAERSGVHDTLARIGLERSASKLIVGVLRIVAVIAVVLTAVAALGLTVLDQALNEAILFIPRLLAALAFARIGIALAGFARERVERLTYQMDLSGPFGAATQCLVIGVFAILALAQLGVPTAILNLLAGIAIAGAALTLALAFGLGGRDLAAEVSASRHARQYYRVGQRIALDGVSGEITAIDPTSTVLRSGHGKLVRVPNSRLLKATVEIEESSGQGHDS